MELESIIDFSSNEQTEQLMKFIKEKLNDELKCTFADHFALSLIDNIEKFPICGEKAMKWLGYTRKDNFKRFFIKNLIEKQDYEMFLRVEEHSKVAKHNNESFNFTVDAFKISGMRTGTEKGNLIRTYYIELEKLIFQYGLYQHQILVEESKRQLKASENKSKILELAWQTEKENVDRLLKRRVNKQLPGHVVYIFRNTDDVTNKMHKLGMTLNVSKREESYRSHNNQGEIVYTKRCCDAKLLEKVMHHLLDQYRETPNREWFIVPFDIIKEVLDTAQLFLDGLVDNCENIKTINIFEKMSNIIKELEKNKIIVESISNKDEDFVLENNIEIEEEKEQEIDIDDAVNPLDFDKFIKDCCEEGQDYYAFSVDLQGRHRLWGRSSKKTTRDTFLKYLNQKYKHAKIFNKESGSKLSSFKGIRIKEIKYEMPNNPSELDIFVNEICKREWVGRTSTKSIMVAFEEWKKIKDPQYILAQIDKVKVNHYFKINFLPALVFTGNHGEHGFFGVSLKNDNSNTGLKQNPKLTKKVVKIDINTKLIVETWNSLTIASQSINRSAGTLSTDIKFKRPIGQYLYKYI
ncbi:Hypothetical protein KVN_LOCUS378 [uncultured virus]|nr:Hypothetical protein KVN_LOCUS378 [uncultured virus]